MKLHNCQLCALLKAEEQGDTENYCIWQTSGRSRGICWLLYEEATIEPPPSRLGGIILLKLLN